MKIANTIKKTASRIETFDLLRGFFILVIIVDHLERWPSLFEFVTGRGELWANAACGFVIISGLLVGYVRGFKGLKLSFTAIVKKLWTRALLLYLWLIIGTVVYAAITWFAPRPELLAWVEIAKGEWWQLITSAVTFAYTNNWVHFLGLYALFLFIAPVFIFLLRKKLALLAIFISLAIYLVGYLTSIEWFEWQALFFIPAVAGFYLESIQGWWQTLRLRTRRFIEASAYALTVLSIIGSVMTLRVFPEAHASASLNDSFSIDPLAIGVIGIAFVWFIAFAFLFQRFHVFIKKYLGWLLLPFGTRSLTAYIIHPISIILASLIFAASSSLILNTFIGIVCILFTWLLVKQRFVQKVLPQ